VDVKALYTFQQLYIYFIPMFTNLGFINAIVALVRFLWFRKHLSEVGEYTYFCDFVVKLEADLYVQRQDF